MDDGDHFYLLVHAKTFFIRHLSAEQYQYEGTFQPVSERATVDDGFRYKTDHVDWQTPSLRISNS